MASVHKPEVQPSLNYINSIYTTVSNCQVHIAADTKYIGSVDSYNNCFTQFFAWLFCRSIAVNFDGKVHSINKKSYTNLIRLLTDGKIKDIRASNIFRPIAEAATLPTNNFKMRDFITRADQQALFKKLAIAIFQGNTSKALLMIGKGADLDNIYYDRDQLLPSFSRDTFGLDKNSKYTFTVFKAPPILQAARRSNTVVRQFLEDAGANLSITGTEYIFKREITNVNRQLTFVVEPRLVPHHYHTKDSNGNKHKYMHYQLGYEPLLQERTFVTTQDSRSGEKIYQLSQDRQALINLR